MSIYSYKETEHNTAMKTKLPLPTAALLLAAAWFGLHPAPARAQGMPPETRNTIHALFDNHAALRRTVTPTTNGYVAVTESDDPTVARTLRRHVSQMRERLESGLGARMWDPAYAEMRRHYSDLTLTIEPTEKGLRVTMVGRTPEAAKVAQNHAQIVSKFIERGWPEHGVEHPAVNTTPASEAKPPEKAAPTQEGRRETGCGQGCRLRAIAK